MPHWNIENLDGLFPLAVFLYAFLISRGTLHKKKLTESQRKSLKPLLKVAGPFIILLGIMQLLGFESKTIK